MTIENIIEQLTSHVNRVPALFLEINQDQLTHKPAPGKWSKKEIMGHLVDSALNNLKRFTDSQILPQPYTIQRYQQNELVAVNHYLELPADHIVSLWKILNQQIIYVMSQIPEEKLAYTVITPCDQTVTLQYWALDYLEHMDHHLKQVLG